MAQDEKGSVPGMLENWGTQTKTARPESVGPHDVKKNQEDPSNDGIDPTAGYKPGPGSNEASAGPSGREDMVTPAGVKEATHIEPGAEREAPPLTGLSEE